MTGKSKGRPTRYTKKLNEDVAKVAKLLESGITDDALAEFFDVSRATISNWKKNHPDFLDTVKAAKDGPDDNVERALYQRAIGYSHPEEKVFQYMGEIVRAQTVKHYPPDTAAAFIWLKNRRPEHWRDKHEINHSGEIHAHFDPEEKDI